MSWEIFAAVCIAVLSTIGVVLAARIGHDPRRERLLKDIEILERLEALPDTFPSRHTLVSSVDERIRWLPKTWAMGAVVANWVGACVPIGAGCFMMTTLAKRAIDSKWLENPELTGILLVLLGGLFLMLGVRWAYWALRHMP